MIEAIDPALQADVSTVISSHLMITSASLIFCILIERHQIR
ncbi:MAG: hypothetical protein ABIN89_04965 [Chitinophagaceae bacterium]